MPSEFEKDEQNGSAFTVDDIIAEYRRGEMISPPVTAPVPDSADSAEIVEPDEKPDDIEIAVAAEITEDETGEKEKLSLSGELYSWAQDLVGCLIFIVLLFIFVIRVIGVDGSSMYPTLENKDMMALLSNVFYTAKAGDIVVIKKEEFREQPIVKRVIATAGQTVDIDFDTGEVRVDGVLMDEPYINETTRRSGDVEYPATVPDGCIFVLGDNRNNSTDSRWNDIGMIDERCVLGKVLMVVFPFKNFGRVT